MKIRRGIFGGALLFAAAGCDVAEKPATDTAAEVSGDTAQADSSGDAQGADSGVDATDPPDAQVVDATDPPDAQVVDATDPPDAQVVDATDPPDAQVVDATDPPDAQVVDATDPPDAQVVDAVVEDIPPPSDVAFPGDADDCKLLGISDALGQKCAFDYTAICDPDDAEVIALMCWGGEWKKMEDIEEEFFGCFCQESDQECEYAQAVCAVPGFVGLDRAGRQRKVIRRLRIV